ncbi:MULTISPECIES: transposase zinc-binding domain-containing protein, partial [Bacteroides]
MRTKFEVAQIISRFKALFYEKYAPCPQVRKVFGHLEQCRTAELGGHVDACPECG